MIFNDFLLVFLDSSCKKFYLSNVENDVYRWRRNPDTIFIDMQNAKIILINKWKILMIAGMIIGAWIMVSLSLAAYGVFIVIKMIILPFLSIHLNLGFIFNGDEVLTCNRYGKENVICLECAYSVFGFLIRILIRKSILVIFSLVHLKINILPSYFC